MARKERSCYTVRADPGKHPVFCSIVEIFAFDIVEAAKLFKEQIPNAGEITSIRQGRI